MLTCATFSHKDSSASVSSSSSRSGNLVSEFSKQMTLSREMRRYFLVCVVVSALLSSTTVHGYSIGAYDYPSAASGRDAAAAVNALADDASVPEYGAGPLEDNNAAAGNLAEEIELLRQYLRGRNLPASPASYRQQPAGGSLPSLPETNYAVQGAYERLRRTGGGGTFGALRLRGGAVQQKRGPGSCINSCLGSAMSFVRCQSMCH